MNSTNNNRTKANHPQPAQTTTSPSDGHHSYSTSYHQPNLSHSSSPSPRPSSQTQLNLQPQSKSPFQPDDVLTLHHQPHSQSEPLQLVGHPSILPNRTEHAHSDPLSAQSSLQPSRRANNININNNNSTTTTITPPPHHHPTINHPPSPTLSPPTKLPIIIQPNLSSSNHSPSSLLPPFDPPLSTTVSPSNLTPTTNDHLSPFSSPPQYSFSPSSSLPPPSYFLSLLRPSIRRRSPTLQLASSTHPKIKCPSSSSMDHSTYPHPPSASPDRLAPLPSNQTLSEKPPSTPQTSSRSFLTPSVAQPQPGSSHPVTLSSKQRSWLDFLLVPLLLVIIGTVVVLSTVNAYMGIYPSDVILPSELEVEPLRPTRVPKIIHQTWKTDQIPDRWIPVRESCAAAHESWEYMLWTDKSGRELIEREYSWFLPIYDGYRYPIQRADAVRYFILHHYGGVYMDLDIGCIRPMDSLLRFDLILPQTVPVGISNDLMFSAKGHPFMDFIIHRLGQFDHDYQLNYATVMFSTGPMALSALLNMFRRSPSFGLTPGMPAFGPVRILPPKLYGKNLAAPQPSPGPYFTHYYGSSWHTDGAGAVLWLGKFGIFWLYGGIALVAFCAARAAIRHCRATTSDNESHLPSAWSTPSLPTKPRGSTGALWKRRLMKVRRAEGRFADVLLLPNHILEKPTPHSSKSPRLQHQKDCIRCKSCTLTQGLIDPNNQLPLYEPRPLHCLAPGRRPPRKSQRTDSAPEDEDWEEIDEDTGLLSSTSTSDFMSTPTPVLLPSTPTFYRNPNLPPTGLPSLRVEAHEEVAPGLPSPLLNAIYRLAEMAGIVSENGQRNELGSNFHARPDDSPFHNTTRPNSTRKVD